MAYHPDHRPCRLALLSVSPEPAVDRGDAARARHVVSYETIRWWGRKFGSAYARRLRRKPPRPTDIWHLDEVVISIAGKKHWLWRAVDQDRYVLDEIVQRRRNTKAAKRLLTQLMKKKALVPKRIITDKLVSYGAARRQVMPRVEQRSHKSLNNRARELARAAAKARLDDARLSVCGRSAAVHVSLFSRQEPVCSTPFTPVRPCHPPLPPPGHGRMERRGGSTCLRKLQQD
jgi:putative transposase